MARLARVVVPGMPHHLTQRGNRREAVFFDEADRRLYLLLSQAQERRAQPELNAPSPYSLQHEAAGGGACVKMHRFVLIAAAISATLALAAVVVTLCVNPLPEGEPVGAPQGVPLPEGGPTGAPEGVPRSVEPLPNDSTAAHHGECTRIGEPQRSPEVQAPTPSLQEAIWQDDIEAVKRNIERGVDVNRELRLNGHPMSPLALAAYLGYEDVAQTLIANGSDIDWRDSWGTTALHYATYKNSCAVIRVLVEHGADVNVSSERKGTPLHSAAAIADKVDTLEAARLLLELGADVNAPRPRDRKTPLHAAVKSGNLPLVRLLVAHGADVHAQDVGGSTPIEWAETWGHEAVIEFLASIAAGTGGEDGK